MTRRLLWLLPVAAVLTFSVSTSPALAGGYDTPILYSARHMGMGGTAQAYVDDSSSLFHNPAGLGNIAFADVMADFSFIVGEIDGAPAENNVTVTSEKTYAPFFLVGGAIRATDWLSFGMAFYPVASAGGTYKYNAADGREIEDTTTLVFLEFTPGVAVNLPFGFNLGAGYRMTFVTLDRQRDAENDTDFSASGNSFAGFRAGLQWNYFDWLSAGVSYRHKTETEVTDDEGKASRLNAENITTTFILPSKVAAGIRGEVAGLGAAVDFEYTFQSQNDRVTFTGEGQIAGMPVDVTIFNIFNWEDAITLRTGVEYDVDVGVGTVTPRLGYIWDQKVYSKTYPSAFGTPPSDTHTATAGVGYDGGPWEVNLAYAFRTGAATVEESDLPPATAEPEDVCAFCGKAGDYELTMHGLYVDFNWQFELGDWTIGRDYWEDPAPTADVE